VIRVAARPKSKSGAQDRVDDAMHATRAAVEEGIVPAAASLCCVLPAALKRIKTQNDDQRTGVEIVPQGALQHAGPPDRRSTAGADGSVIVGQDPREEQYSSLRLADGEYGNLVHQRHHRPTRWFVGDPERSLGCGSPITTEAMVAELPKKGGAGGGGIPPAAAAWAAWTSKSNVSELNQTERPAAMPALLLMPRAQAETLAVQASSDRKKSASIRSSFRTSRLPFACTSPFLRAASSGVPPHRE